MSLGSVLDHVASRRLPENACLTLGELMVWIRRRDSKIEAATSSVSSLNAAIEPSAFYVTAVGLMIDNTLSQALTPSASAATARHGGSRAMPPSPVTLATKPSGKRDVPGGTGPVLKLASFPFRLAIIQELMFEQELLIARFEVSDFAQGQSARAVDPPGSGDGVIPAVRSWFRTLPIAARFAEHVETLVLDGRNDIYLQLIPQWDGEEDIFVVKNLSLEDLAPFTKLHAVNDVGGFLSLQARTTLIEHGVLVS